MKRLVYIILSSLAILSCGGHRPVFPENRKPVLVSDRLSNPSVTAFCTDALGRMWIGTERGLNRFNGYDYHQYSFSNDTLGLPGNYISDIALDRSGRIWVGTEDGVAVFSENTGFRRIPVHSKEKAVSQILCGKDGKVYLSMMEDFCVLDSLTGAFESRIPKIDRCHSYCQRCYLDENEYHLWSVASLEITRYNLETFERTDTCLTSHFVATSTMLSNGEIWMAGRNAISVFDTRTLSMKPLPEAIRSNKTFMRQDIEFIAEVDSSTILFKTSEGQLFCYMREEEALMEVPPSMFRIPPSFALKSVYLDSSHRLWLASDNNGFAVRPPLSGSNYYGLDSGELGSASIVSASRDSKGIIWLASLHDGLFRYDPHSGTLSKPRLSHHSYIEKSYYLHSNNPLVMADSSGFIWITPPDRPSIVRGRYKDGLIAVKDDFPLFYPRVALCDSEGGVWIGTFNYYIHYMPKDGSELKRLQLYPSKTTQITCLLEYENSILVGAYNEPLIMVNRKSLQTELLPITQDDYEECTPRGFFYPTTFLLYSDGSILVGTRFNGILRYDPASARLERLKGSPEIDISAIEEDAEGQIWASTSNGVFVYNPGEGTWYDYYSPLITEGMYFYDRSSLADTDGSLLFGTSQGIMVINPAEKPTGNEGKLFFEDIRIQDKTYPVGDSRRIVLPHYDNDFAITFAAPVFQSVDKIHYKYILEGKGDQWIDLGAGREIYFNKLPSGNYTLKVRHCMGQDDVLSESSLKIRVKPHPLLSIPFIILYIVLALFILWWIGRTKKRIMDEKRAAREAEFEMEQEKRINKMNMTFFSNISHEFRTPLTMIYGPVSQLSDDPSLWGKQRSLISLVRGSIERMLSLVNQLMDISKLENSTLGLKVNRADIVPVIENSLAVFKVNSEALGIKFNVKGLEYPLLTWFDSDKIQKIISNLLSNALKFTPKGGAISFELDEEIRNSEPYIRITISDTGIGIPEDKLESIFEKYYQVDSKGSAGAMNNHGTGIGLYHARNLATIHHGTLFAANRPGGGATFTLLFPKSESSYSEEEKDYGEASVSGRFPIETVSAIPDTKIISESVDKFPLLLAVDDDPDIIRYLFNLFSSEYRFAAANSTDEALALANDTHPDIILSDVAMPEKDGFELCRSIKRDLQLCHIPVVLVTAMGAMENQVQGLEEGADAYVTKPFNPAYLKALVRSQLENRSLIRRQVNEAVDSSSIEAISRRDKAFLDQVYSIMESKLSDEELDVAGLAAILGISRTKFYYKMKGLTGKSPSEFFLQYKLNIASRLLNEGVLNISEIAIKTGFVSLSHFSKSFKKQFGVSPSKYKG
ncbi:MAG: response regulator [Bacteroidales bacterium]|nr:response regulator [Bacteroidales bacterium]